MKCRMLIVYYNIFNYILNQMTELLYFDVYYKLQYFLHRLKYVSPDFRSPPLSTIYLAALAVLLLC